MKLAMRLNRIIIIFIKWCDIIMIKRIHHEYDIIYIHIMEMSN